MNIIEETYCIVNKQSGRDQGLIVINSRLDARGGMATDMQLLPLGDRPLEAGEYRLEFVKKLMIDTTTRRRFAPMLVANSNHKGGGL
jgi:hypothetical protein